ncbi:aminoglycoside phosphotransferase family protein [Actinotalea sp.]|uniref:aminoglycoside phosphotransferase family protein n=1 Tax=Actinotalea sp. TaxID=1872145 RepID=UPI00356703E7
MTVPDGPRPSADRDESSSWLDALPHLVEELLAEWELTVDGPPAHGRRALVLPVSTGDGTPAALKLSRPHHESRYEHLALQHWHGQGSVLLLRADPRRWALLLERAQQRDLRSLDDVEACTVVGGLLARLHRPAPPQLALLSVAAADWSARLSGLPRSAPLPRRLVEQSSGLCRDLASDPATDGTLIHTDAHHENVLAAEREPWLVIGPKPLSGDPHFEPAPLLSHRWDELVAASDLRWAVRRRLDAVVDALGLDPDRARDWVVVRETVHALWSIEAARDAGRALTPADRERITRAVTIAKAVQD